MIPTFALHRPTTSIEVIELRRELEGEAALLCGGTELLLIMKLGLADYPHLIDLKRVPELTGIEEVDGSLRIGAASTHRQIERSPLVKQGWPQLAELERSVANVRVRNVGSIGGNLCFADPHSDPATFLTACDATVTVLGPGGERTLPIAEFTLGMYETALGEDELLTAVTVPRPAQSSGFAHRKMCLTERPAVTTSVQVRTDGEAITGSSVVVGSVGGRPTRIAEAEEQLLGGRAADLEPTRLASAAEAAAQGTEPSGDGVVSADYKRQLVRVLTERTVQDAARRAAGLAPTN